MKSIISEDKAQEVLVNNLSGKELIAYRCKNTSHEIAYAVLVKLRSDNYGFVPLNNSDSKPRYEARNWFAAVELAAKSRELKAFDSMGEMISAMYNNKF